MYMHLACSLSIVLTLLVSFIPGLNSVFKLRPIVWWQIVISLMWGVLNLFLDEAVGKTGYKAHVRRQKRKQAKAAAEHENDVRPIQVNAQDDVSALQANPEPKSASASPNPTASHAFANG